MKDYAFSKYIVALRHRQGLSRFDLARKLGIGYVTVAKWENAEAMPTVEELQKLSVFFNLSCEAIRAHSFVELPGCSVKPQEVKSAPEMAPAPAAEPAPVVEAPAPVAEPAPVVEAPAPAAEPVPDKKPPVVIVYKPKEEPTPAIAPAPVREPVPVVEAPAPAAEPVPVVEAPAPVAEPVPVVEAPAPAAEPAPEAAEPIASTTDMPKIDLNVIKNPEAEAFFEKKRIENKNEEIVSSHKRSGVKIRRLFAILLDEIFCAIFAFIVAIAAVIVMVSLSLTDDVITAATLLVAYVAFCLGFVLRDAIIGGTSLGKRIFGLYVVDKVNATKPVVWQRVVRSLGQVFFSTPDAIVVLISGRGIGDYVAGTAVVSRKDYNDRLAEKNPLDPPVKVRKNRTVVTAFLIIVGVALVTAFMVGVSYITMVMLENEKQTEEYLYAYDALLESDEFSATGADSSEIIFTAFNRYTSLEDGGSVTVVEYTFETEEYYIYVTVKSSLDGIIVTEILVEQAFVLE